MKAATSFQLPKCFKVNIVVSYSDSLDRAIVNTYLLITKWESILLKFET